MIEGSDGYQPLSRWEQAGRQFDSPLNLQWRRGLLKYNLQPVVEKIDLTQYYKSELLAEAERTTIDLERAVIALLELQGDEEIVDYACGDASLLWYIFLKHGHSGEMLGIDRSAENFYDRKAARDRYENITGQQAPISFMQFDLESGPVPIADKRVDVSFLNNILYHLNNPYHVIDQAVRTTRVGGKVVTLSKGTNHLKQLFELNVPIAGELGKLEGHEGIYHPKTFYDQFDIQATQSAMLSRPELKLVAGLPLFEPLFVPPTTSGRRDIMLASFSFGDSFEPKKPNIGYHWLAVDKVVGNFIDQQIKQHGGVMIDQELQADIYEVVK